MSKYKLRFQILLPITQLLLALVMIAWGRQVPRPAGLDFPYSPTPVLVCNGINAPATVLSLSASFLPIDRPDRTPISLFGFGAQGLLFLLGVVLLWFFIGHTIDHRLRRPASVRHTAGAARSILDVVLMLLGILLLLVGIAPILDNRGDESYGRHRGSRSVVSLVFGLVFFAGHRSRT